MESKNLEKSILATLLDTLRDNGNKVYIMESLEKSDFYQLEHQDIFDACKKLYDEQGSIEMTQVVHFLKYKKNIDILGDIAQYASLSKVESPVIKIKTLKKARNLIAEGERLKHRINSCDNLDVELSNIERDLVKIMITNSSGAKWHRYDNKNMSEIIKNIQRKIEDKTTQGMTMGLPKLDKITGGAKGGELIIITARPGMGKSSYALSTIIRQLMAGYKPALFSLEMPKEQVDNKMLSIRSELIDQLISYQTLRNPYGNKSMLKKLRAVVNDKILTNGNFHLNTEALTYPMIKSYARELKAKGLLDSLFIDQLNLMVQDSNYERQEITQYTRGLKKFAKELDVPIFLLHQLSRKKGVERPTLSELKSSGSVEEDADFVICPWRPYAINREGDPTEADLDVLKARDSAIGVIPAVFSVESTLFRQGIDGVDGVEYTVGGDNEMF